MQIKIAFAFTSNKYFSSVYIIYNLRKCFYKGALGCRYLFQFFIPFATFVCVIVCVCVCVYGWTLENCNLIQVWFTLLLKPTLPIFVIVQKSDLTKILTSDNKQ